MDTVYRSFLENTLREALDLARRSDVLRVTPEARLPPAAYLCQFLLPYLRRGAGGIVEVSPGPVVCYVRFPQDYLWSTDSHLGLRIASVANRDFVHPNAVGGGPVCLGAEFRPGTSFGELIWQLYSIVSYRNRTVDERNAFDAEACRLLRSHDSLLAGLEPPPLFRKRKTLGPSSIRKVEARL